MGLLLICCFGFCSGFGWFVLDCFVAGYVALARWLVCCCLLAGLELVC